VTSAGWVKVAACGPTIGAFAWQANVTVKLAAEAGAASPIKGMSAAAATATHGAGKDEEFSSVSTYLRFWEGESGKPRGV